MDKVEKTETTIEEAHPYQYDMIAENSLDYDQDERDRLCKEIGKLIQRVAYLSWLNPNTRTLLHLEWQRRRTLSTIVQRQATISS